MSVGTGRSSPRAGRALAAMPRSSSAPAAVGARRHAATAARTGLCGRGSLPSSPAGRCGAPAAAGSSFRARRWISATPTDRPDALPRRRARGLQSRRGWERRGTAAECPIARIRRRLKNAGETRGVGSLSRWPFLGDGPAGSRECGRWATQLFLAPRLALVHSAWLDRGRVRGNSDAAFGQRRRSDLTVQSVLLGPHGIGGSTDAPPTT